MNNDLTSAIKCWQEIEFVWYNWKRKQKNCRVLQFIENNNSPDLIESVINFVTAWKTTPCCSTLSRNVYIKTLKHFNRAYKTGDALLEENE